MPKDDRTVAIAGLGAIGATVASQLDAGRVGGLRLSALAGRDRSRSEQFTATLECDPALVPLDRLADHADIVVECLPSSVFDQVAIPAVDAGRILIVLSAGALLERADLIARADVTGARIIVPSGAILGLDAICAAAEGRIGSVTIVTRKPPKGLLGAAYLDDNGIDISNLSKPLCVFEGPVREAARHFPANVNVAAAVSLAGIGADRTCVEVWADPGLERNTHAVSVVSDSANFTMTIEGLPTDQNPRTGRITPQSVIATLRRLTAPLVIGT